MRTILFCAVLLLGAMPAWAQTNFQPGYLVSLAGDTLRGEVDVRGERRNARVCQFRSTPEATPTQYVPSQVRGYGITDGRNYQTVQRPASATSPKNGMGAAEPVFMEVVVLGTASLFYFHDQGDVDRYYLRLKEEPIRELRQTIEEVVLNGRRVTRQTNEFQYVLSEAMKGCLSMQPEIGRARFSAAVLAKLVQRYNACVGAGSVAPVASQRRTKVTLGVIGGLQQSELVYNTYTQDFKARSGALPVAGLAMQLRLVGLSRNLLARVEALYDDQRFKSQSFQPVYGYHYELRTHQSSLQVPVMIRYTFPKGKLRPYAQGGFVPRWLIEVQNELTATNALGDVFARRPLVTQPRSYDFGFNVALGLTTAREKARNLGLELRYERNSGFSDDVAVGMQQQRYYLLLSYDLTK